MYTGAIFNEILSQVYKKVLLSRRLVTKVAKYAFERSTINIQLKTSRGTGNVWWQYDLLLIRLIFMKEMRLT